MLSDEYTMIVSLDGRVARVTYEAHVHTLPSYLLCDTLIINQLLSVEPITAYQTLDPHPRLTPIAYPAAAIH